MKKIIVLSLLLFLLAASSCQNDITENSNGENLIPISNSQIVSKSSERDSMRAEHHQLVISALNKRMYDMIDEGQPLFPVCSYNELAEFLVPDYLDKLPIDPLQINNYTYVALPDGYSYYLGYWRETDGLTYGEKFVTN